MTCGTLLSNNFVTVAVRKMPKYTNFTITHVSFSNAKYVHEKRFDTGFKAYVTSRMPNTPQNCILKETRHHHHQPKNERVFYY